MKNKKLAEKVLQEALLLMNYNPSKTLTENLEEINNPLLEQVVAEPKVVEYDELVKAVRTDGSGLIDLLDFPTSEGDLDNVIALFKKYDNHFAKDPTQDNKMVSALEIISRVYADQNLGFGESLEGSINNTKFPFNAAGDEKKRIAISLLNRIKKQKSAESGAQSPETQWQAGDVKSQQTFLNKFVYNGCLQGGNFKNVKNPQIQDLVVAYIIPEQGPDGKTADVYYWANKDSGYYGASGKYVSIDEWVCND